MKIGIQKKERDRGQFYALWKSKKNLILDQQFGDSFRPCSENEAESLYS
jgi:hypothetical protein